MYLALRRPGSGPAAERPFYASREFLDRAELEMARRETVDYLERSQYVLLDVLGSAASPDKAVRDQSAAEARELLSKKKYLNGQLDKFQMAKAKALCDQIERLFLELAQVGDGLPGGGAGQDPRLRRGPPARPQDQPGQERTAKWGLT